MKKFLALLLALVMVFALAACGEADAPASDAPASEAPASDAPASEAPADGAAGSVYYLNFKPEADAAWQELAADRKSTRLNSSHFTQSRMPSSA